MQSFDDHHIMQLVKNGQTEKLGLLFERYQKHLYNLFLWQTHNPCLSEDLVQEVFYRILKYRHSYRGNGQFKTWLFSIAHSARIDHFRKKKHPTTSIDAACVIADESPEPDQIIESEDQNQHLYQALSQLSEIKREMLYMSRFQYMKYEEIADATGIKLGTVKSTIHMAIKELAGHFNKLTKEEKQ